MVHRLHRSEEVLIAKKYKEAFLAAYWEKKCMAELPGPLQTYATCAGSRYQVADEPLSECTGHSATCVRPMRFHHHQGEGIFLTANPTGFREAGGTLTCSWSHSALVKLSQVLRVFLRDDRFGGGGATSATESTVASIVRTQRMGVTASAARSRVFQISRSRSFASQGFFIVGGLLKIEGIPDPSSRADFLQLSRRYPCRASACAIAVAPFL